MIYYALSTALSIYLGIKLAIALECYSHTGNEPKKLVNSKSNFLPMCSISTKLERSASSDEVFTIRPDVMICFESKSKDNTTICWCGTDRCNLDFPNPIPPFHKRRTEPITCRDTGEPPNERNRTCTGLYVCVAQIRRSDNVTMYSCEDKLLGPFNGCRLYSEAEIKYVKKVCLCDTKYMCDPFEVPAIPPQTNDENDSGSTATKIRNEKLLFLAALIWMMLIA